MSVTVPYLSANMLRFIQHDYTVQLRQLLQELPQIAAPGGATLFPSSFITYSLNSHHLRQRPSRSNENCRQRPLTLSPDVTGAGFHPTHQLSVSTKVLPSPYCANVSFFLFFLFFMRNKKGEGQGNEGVTLKL